MTLRYLLDTTTCIFIIKNRPESARQRFGALRPGEVGISTITEAELRFGAATSAQRESNLAAILDFTSQMAVLPFDSPTTAPYGVLRASLARAGAPIGPLELLIAATALAHGLTLVTTNTRELVRVSGLRLEDWTE